MSKEFREISRQIFSEIAESTSNARSAMALRSAANASGDPLLGSDADFREYMERQVAAEKDKGESAEILEALKLSLKEARRQALLTAGRDVGDEEVAAAELDVNDPEAQTTELSFEYKSDFDENGILYFLGTQRGQAPWKNPADLGAVAVLSSSTGDNCESIHAVVGRTAQRCLTRAEADSWFVIDMNKKFVRPTAYTLRHYISYDTEALRNWEFQGSVDGDHWETIKKHTEDPSLKERGSSKTWTTPDAKTFYSYFRILSTGKNSNGNLYLALSGFEVYGTMRVSMPSPLGPREFWWMRSFSQGVKFSRRVPSRSGCPTFVVLDNPTGDWVAVKAKPALSVGRPRIKFVIENSGDTKNSWKIVVGVAPASFGPLSKSKCLGGISGGWGYVANGQKYCKQGNIQGLYGTPYTSGAVIEVQLDFDLGTIEFFNNEVSQGIMANNLKGIVFPAVSCTAVGTRITVVSARSDAAMPQEDDVVSTVASDSFARSRFLYSGVTSDQLVPLKLVSTNGGAFGDNYTADNMLRDDNSLHCTMLPRNVDVVCEHPDSTDQNPIPIWPTGIIIKRATTCTHPLRFGAIFVLDSLKQVEETERYNDMRGIDYITYRSNNEALLRNDSDFLAVHPVCFFDAGGDQDPITFPVERLAKGRYVLIKMISSIHDDRPLSLDVKFIGVYGFSKQLPQLLEGDSAEEVKAPGTVSLTDEELARRAEEEKIREQHRKDMHAKSEERRKRIQERMILSLIQQICLSSEPFIKYKLVRPPPFFDTVDLDQSEKQYERELKLQEDGLNTRIHSGLLPTLYSLLQVIIIHALHSSDEDNEEVRESLPSDVIGYSAMDALDRTAASFGVYGAGHNYPQHTTIIVTIEEDPYRSTIRVRKNSDAPLIEELKPDANADSKIVNQQNNTDQQNKAADPQNKSAGNQPKAADSKSPKVYNPAELFRRGHKWVKRIVEIFTHAELTDYTVRCLTLVANFYAEFRLFDQARVFAMLAMQMARNEDPSIFKLRLSIVRVLQRSTQIFPLMMLRPLFKALRGLQTKADLATAQDTIQKDDIWYIGSINNDRRQVWKHVAFLGQFCDGYLLNTQMDVSLLNNRDHASKCGSFLNDCLQLMKEKHKEWLAHFTPENLAAIDKAQHLLAEYASLGAELGNVNMLTPEANGFAVLIKRFLATVRDMADGAMLLAPGGWFNDKKAHGVVYLIERESKDSFSFCVCNMGSGLQYHPSSVSEYPKPRHQATIRLKNIPAERLLDEAVWYFIFKLQVSRTQENAMQVLYEVILPFLTGEPLAAAILKCDFASDPGLEFCSPQRSPQTYFRCVLEALRYVLRRFGLSKNQIRQLTFAIRVCIMEMVEQDLTNLPQFAAEDPDSQKQQQLQQQQQQASAQAATLPESDIRLIRIACRQLAHGSIKETETRPPTLSLSDISRQLENIEVLLKCYTPAPTPPAALKFDPTDQFFAFPNFDLIQSSASVEKYAGDDFKTSHALIDFTELPSPQSIKSFSSVSDALKRCITLCEALQALQSSASYYYRSSLIQHLVLQVLPFPAPDPSAEDDAKHYPLTPCVYRDAEISYDMQCLVLDSLLSLATHYCVSVKSVGDRPTFRSAQIVVIASILSIADAVARIHPIDQVSPLTMVLNGTDHIRQSISTPEDAVEKVASFTVDRSKVHGNRPLRVTPEQIGAAEAQALDEELKQRVEDAAFDAAEQAAREAEDKAFEDEKSEEWACATCTFINRADLAACELCQTANPNPNVKHESWKCEICDSSNPGGRKFCASCKVRRVPIPRPTRSVASAAAPPRPPFFVDICSGSGESFAVFSRRWELVRPEFAEARGRVCDYFHAQEMYQNESADRKEKDKDSQGIFSFKFDSANFKYTSSVKKGDGTEKFFSRIASILNINLNTENIKGVGRSEPLHSRIAGILCGSTNGLLMKRVPELLVLRDLTALFKLMLADDDHPRRRVALQRYTFGDGKLTWESQSNGGFNIMGFGLTKETPFYFRADPNNKTNRSFSDPATHLNLQPSQGGWKPGQVREEDILIEKNLPSFDDLLTQEDTEKLLSVLTVPYIRLPLVLSFFTTKDRVSALLSDQLQQLVQAVVFEPQYWTSGRNILPVETVPLDDAQLLGSPYGALLNQLRRRPQTLISSLMQLASIAIKLDTGDYTCSSCVIVLFVVRLLSRVAGYVNFALFRHAKEGTADEKQPAAAQVVPNEWDLPSQIRAELTEFRDSLLKLFLGPFRKILNVWDQQAQNKADIESCCVLNAHLAMLYNIMQPSEFQSDQIAALLAHMCFLRSWHSPGEGKIEEVDAELQRLVQLGDQLQLQAYTRAKTARAAREARAQKQLEERMAPVSLVKFSDAELFDLLQVYRERIIQWLRAANPTEVDDVLEAALRSSLRNRDMSCRGWVRAEKYQTSQQVGVYEFAQELGEIQINVQSCEVWFHHEHIQPVPSTMARLTDFRLLFKLTSDESHASSNDKSSLDSSAAEQAAVADLLVQKTLERQLHCAMMSNKANRQWVRLLGRSYNLQLWVAPKEIETLDNHPVPLPMPKRTLWRVCFGCGKKVTASDKQCVQCERQISETPFGFTYMGVMYGRVFSQSQVFSSERWVYDALNPVLVSQFKSMKGMDFELFLPTAPLPPEAQVCRLLSVHQGIVREFLVRKERGIVDMFVWVEHGRRLYRQMCYTSDSRFGLTCLQINSQQRKSLWDSCTRYAAGDLNFSPTLQDSLVISRNFLSNGDSAVETLMPSRVLQGLLPETLLENFLFWRSESPTPMLRGFPRQLQSTFGDAKAAKLAAEAVDTEWRYCLEVLLVQMKLDQDLRCSSSSAIVRRLPLTDESLTKDKSGADLFSMKRQVDPEAQVRQLKQDNLKALTSQGYALDLAEAALIVSDFQLVAAQAMLSDSTHADELLKFVQNPSLLRPIEQVAFRKVMDQVTADEREKALRVASHLRQPSSIEPKQQMTLLNLTHAQAGSPLHRLASSLARIEDLSHILVWTNDKIQNENSSVTVSLVELPRLRLHFAPMPDKSSSKDSIYRLFSLDHTDLFISDYSSPLINQLKEGIPQYLVMENYERELFLLVPSSQFYRPVVMAAPFSTELVIDRADRTWRDNCVNSRFFLYPVHPSQTLLLTPTQQSAFYLLLLKFAARRYDEVCSILRSCEADQKLTDGEAWTLSQLRQVALDHHPDAHACRLRVALCILHSQERYPFDLVEEYDNYLLKLPVVSNTCRLSAEEELIICKHILAGQHDDNARIDRINDTKPSEPKPFHTPDGVLDVNFANRRTYLNSLVKLQQTQTHKLSHRSSDSKEEEEEEEVKKPGVPSLLAPATPEVHMKLQIPPQRGRAPLWRKVEARGSELFQAYYREPSSIEWDAILYYVPPVEELRPLCTTALDRLWRDNICGEEQKLGFAFLTQVSLGAVKITLIDPKKDNSRSFARLFSRFMYLKNTDFGDNDLPDLTTSSATLSMLPYVLLSVFEDWDLAKTPYTQVEGDASNGLTLKPPQQQQAQQGRAYPYARWFQKLLADAAPFHNTNERRARLRLDEELVVEPASLMISLQLPSAQSSSSDDNQRSSASRPSPYASSAWLLGYDHFTLDVTCSSRSVSCFSVDGANLNEQEKADLCGLVLAPLGLDTFVILQKEPTKVDPRVPFDVSSHKDARRPEAIKLLERLKKDMESYAGAANDATTAKLVSFSEDQIRRLTRLDPYDKLDNRAAIEECRLHLTKLRKALNDIREVDMTQIPAAINFLNNFSNRVVTHPPGSPNTNTHPPGSPNKSKSAQLDEDDKQRYLLKRVSGQHQLIRLEFLTGLLLSPNAAKTLCAVNRFLSPLDADTILNCVTALLLRVNRVGHIDRCIAMSRRLSDLLRSVEAAGSRLPEREMLYQKLVSQCAALASALLVKRVIMGKESAGQAKPFDYDPRFLVFEYLFNIILRPSQVRLVRAFVDASREGRSMVQQMIMGAGKTTVIAPLLSLILATSQSLVMHVVPAALLDFSRDILRSRFTHIFPKRVHTLTFDRSVKSVEEVLSVVEKLTAARKACGVVVSTPESVKSVMLKYLELMHLLDKNAPSSDFQAETRRRSDMADRISDILSIWRSSLLVMDEVDLLLHPLRSELNFPIDQKVILDERQVRWELCIHLFDAIFYAQSQRISSTFTDSAVAKQQLAEIARVLKKGVQSRFLQTVPHLILLNVAYYHQFIKPPLANWLMLWLREKHIFSSSGVLSQQGANPEPLIVKWLVDGPTSLTQEQSTSLSSGLKSRGLQLVNLCYDWLNSFCPHVFSKIHRVSFGLLNKEDEELVDARVPFSRRLVAIPFVGKDVPSHASQFAHPDVLIGLTVLAYRYQGLRMADLRRVVELLQREMRNEIGPLGQRPSSLLFQQWVEKAERQLRQEAARSQDDQKRSPAGSSSASSSSSSSSGSTVYGSSFSPNPTVDSVTPGGPSEEQSSDHRYAAISSSTKVDPDTKPVVAVVGGEQRFPPPVETQEGGEAVEDPINAPIDASNFAPLSTPHVIALPLFQLSDRAQMANLFELVHLQPDVIHFYLERMVFPEVLVNQKWKLSASGQELGGSALFQQRFGFSGTPSDLLPRELGECVYERGSEGQIMNTLVNEAVVSVHFLDRDSDTEQWTVESLLTSVAKLQPVCQALIDTGALVTGFSNLQVARFLLHRLPQQLEGVVYLDRQDRQMILLRQTGQIMPLAQCGIPKEKRFTFYDQVHTTGIDITHSVNARAVLTLGKDMNFRDYSQGAYRMRGIGRGQTVVVYVIPEVNNLIHGELTLSSAYVITPRDIAAWLTVNSLKSERLQISQLVQQNQANIHRKKALQILLAETSNQPHFDGHSIEAARPLRFFKLPAESSPDPSPNSSPRLFSAAARPSLSDVRKMVARFREAVDFNLKKGNVALLPQLAAPRHASAAADDSPDDNTAPQRMDMEMVTEEEQEAQKQKERQVEIEERVQLPLENDGSFQQPWRTTHLQQFPVGSEARSLHPFYPLRNFSIYGEDLTFGWPSNLLLSKNYVRPVSKRLKLRPLKNVTAILEWMPSAVSTDEDHSTLRLKHLINPAHFPNLLRSLAMMGFKGHPAMDPKALQLVLTLMGYEVTRDVAATILSEINEATGVAIGAPPNVRAIAERCCQIISQYTLEPLRYFVAISLREAESLLRLIHTGHPGLQSVSLALRTLEGQTIDCTPGYHPASPPYTNLALQCFRFFNCESFFSTLESALLLLGLSENKEVMRRAYFENLSLCRRRSSRSWQNTPLAQIFVLKNPVELVAHRAKVAAIRNAIPTTQGLRDAFHRWDASGDNLLSRTELAYACERMNLDLTADDICGLLSMADVDENGQLDVEEFLQLLRDPEVEEEAKDEVGPLLLPAAPTRRLSALRPGSGLRPDLLKQPTRFQFTKDIFERHQEEMRQLEESEELKRRLQASMVAEKKRKDEQRLKDIEDANHQFAEKVRQQETESKVWMCECTMENSIQNSKCHFCGAERVIETADQFDDLTSLNHWCCLCSEQNALNRDSCRRCHTKRPDNATLLQLQADVLVSEVLPCPFCKKLLIGDFKICAVCRLDLSPHVEGLGLVLQQSNEPAPTISTATESTTQKTDG